MSVMRQCLPTLALIALFLAGCRDAPSERAAVDTPKADAPAAVAQPAPAAKPGVRITQVRADRFAFDPAKDEAVTIRFNIDRTAEVVLIVYDGRDRLIRRVEGGELAPGEHALAWDGRDSRKQPVPPEAYVYTVIAKAAQGGPVTHDLTDLTGGEPLTVNDVRWDPNTGQVHYVLDKPARVNIRFGLRDGGPYLRTLIDWVPRAAGAQSEAWDGWDASRILPLARHPMLLTGVKAYSLPDNTLFVGPQPKQVTFAELPEEPRRERQPLKGPKRIHFHADQPLETRGDVSASLTIDGPVKQDAQGRWIVSGRTPVRLHVAEADRARVLSRRFEPVFFVDGTFAFENEVGFLPMTWQWDTSTVNEGEHFVTVNVRGYEGNFGAATLKVWVQHPPKSASRTAQDATAGRKQ
jgi:hypothetical protein